MAGPRKPRRGAGLRPQSGCSGLAAFWRGSKPTTPTPSRSRRGARTKKPRAERGKSADMNGLPGGGKSTDTTTAVHSTPRHRTQRRERAG